MDDVRDIAARLAGIDNPRALLEALFAHSPFAFQVYSADGRSLLVNKAFRDLFDSEPPPEYNVLQDEIGAQNGMLALIQRAFTGEIVQTPTFWYDPRELRDIQVEGGRRVAISITVFPLRDSAGKVDHVVFCFRDDTIEALARERSDLEQHKLRISEANLAEAQRIAQLGSWELDLFDLDNPSSNPLRWSDEVFRIFGYEPRAFVVSNEAFFAAIHPDDRGVVAAAVAAAIATCTPYRLDHRVIRPDGVERIVHEHAEVIVDVSGRPVRLVGTVHDITERKRLDVIRLRSGELELQNRRIQEANRLKGEFLANMSHELRTPLNAIIGFAELLHDGDIEPGSPQYKEFAGDIVTSGRHLLQLINDVLDLSKVEAGRMDFHPVPVLLSDVVGEVCAILRTIAAGKHIRLEESVDPAVDAATIDPARLKQVLYNYLSNALKFTPDGGRVAVRVVPETSETFRLEVEDTGIGIADIDIEGLFVEFHQLDNPLTKRHPGTGLGLALTRRLVEAQGGWVGVKTKLGEGSTFHAVLPRDAVPTTSTIRSRTSSRRVALPHAARILVVEDNSLDERFLTDVLGSAGYAVEVAVDASSALALCRRQRFDAIILDLLLPDLNGLDLLVALRAAGLDQEAAVIITTVVADVRAVSTLGVHEVLRKPLDPGALLMSLQRARVLPTVGGGGDS